MTRIALALTASLLLATTSGCSWARHRVNVEGMHERSQQLQVGSSTQEDALAAFGTHPNRVQELKNGNELWSYVFGDGKTESFNMIILGFTKSNIGLDTALLTFDPDGVLKGMWLSSNSTDLEWETWPFGDEEHEAGEDA